MTKQHPFTPPQRLMDAWQARIESMGSNTPEILLEIAQWGADQAFKACLTEVESIPSRFGIPFGKMAANALREMAANALRPQPPSLKEQALTALTRYTTGETILTNESVDTIRRALEQLDA